MQYFTDFFTTGYLSRNITLMFFFLIILVARLLLSRFPARYRYMLWAVFAFKIIFDLSLSAGSFRNMYSESYSSQTEAAGDAFEGQDIVYDGAYAAAYEEVTVLSVDGQGADQMLSENRVSVSDRISAFLSVLASFLSPGLFFVWIIGSLGMIVTGYIRYLKLLKKIKASVRIGSRLYSCDYIDSPIAVGFIRPGVYVPSGYDTEFLRPSIEHEMIHIKRKDTLFKLFAYILLAVYWMNPLAWISFKLFSLDMEISCDEMVLKSAEDSKIKKYAELLLYFASGGKSFDPASAAFGTTDIEKRVKNMKNKKLIGAVSAFALIVILATTVLSFVKLPGTDVRAAQTSSTDQEKVASGEEIAAADNAEEELLTVTEDAADNTAVNTEASDTLQNEAVSAAADTLSDDASDDANVNTAEVTDGEVPEGSEEGISVITGKDGWVWPVQGESFITAGFGERTRETENGVETVIHPEVDIAAEPERTIVCAKDGIVSDAGFNEDLGNYIVVKVSDELSVTYTHLSSTSVSVGNAVSAGSAIGTLGSTGRSTGPHLGFMVTVGSVPVDPMTYYN